MALFWALLPISAGMKTMQPMAVPAPAPAPADGGDNAMANTYGFLRTASNNVGNTVENVLNVEGSLADMKKDLDTEYKRWMAKKKVLLQEREEYSSEAARLKAELEKQKEMQEEKKRIEGDIALMKAENLKKIETMKEAEAKRALDKKVMDEAIEALKCQTKTIQQAKQDKVDAANKQTAVLKQQNTVLQERVFEMNKEVQKLQTSINEQAIRHRDAKSVLLAKVDETQKQIHALEKELLIQAQLSETVERSRERLAAQSGETVKQREKLVKAQATCSKNKKQMVDEIEATKRSLNDANAQMQQCQNLDAENQRMTKELNECMLRKHSMR